MMEFAPIEGWSDLDALLETDIARLGDAGPRFAAHVAAALHSLLHGGAGINLAKFLRAARLLDRNGLRIAMGTEWSDFLPRLRQLASVAPLPAAIDGHLVLFALTAMESGRRTALANLLAAARVTSAPGEVGAILARFGLLDWFAHDDLQSVADIEAIGGEPPDVTAGRIDRLVDTLLPCDAMPASWVEMVFEGIVLPALLAGIRHDRISLSLYLENRMDRWLKVDESEEHYQRCTGKWAPAMRDCGRQRGKKLEPHPPCRADGLLRVGFFVHSASMLAHVSALRATLAGVQRLSPRPFESIVYAFTGYDEAMHDAFGVSGIPVVFLDRERAPDSLLERFLWLRQRLADDGITAVVWLCFQIWLAFAFGLRLAPVQIWWSMKLHPLYDDCDGYISLRNGFQPSVTHHGRVWRTVRYSDPYAFDERFSGPARAIRASFPADAVVFGTLAREEKIAGEEFLSAMCRILKHNRNAVWLYTGRSNHPLIRQAVSEQGVAEQARFIGWVDTKLYSQVIDIFADSWPVGSGMTLIESMSAGKPILFHGLFSELGGYVVHGMSATEVSDDIKTMIRDCFTIDRSFDLLPCAATPEEFVNLGDYLVRDRDHRERCGKAARRFAERVFLDNEEPARALGRHIQEITAAACLAREG